MALFSIGPLVFELLPLNAVSLTRDIAGDYAKKPVVGGKQPYQAMGEGEDTFSISGRLFPERFGGKGALELLERMIKAQDAHLFVRGDGVPHGWVVLTEYAERHTYLGADGVGRFVEVDVQLASVPQPSAASAMSSLFRLLS